MRRAHAVHPVAAGQYEWSLFSRDLEDELVPTLRELGIGVVAYSPLGRGFLTGKYRRGQPLPESQRAASVQQFLNDRNFDLLDKLETLGKARNATPAQMALGWLLTRDNVSSVIIGANTVAQLADSLGASGLRLNAEEMQALDGLSAYPN